MKINSSSCNWKIPHHLIKYLTHFVIREFFGNGMTELRLLSNLFFNFLAFSETELPEPEAK